MDSFNEENAETVNDTKLFCHFNDRPQSAHSISTNIPAAFTSDVLAFTSAHYCRHLPNIQMNMKGHLTQIKCFHPTTLKPELDTRCAARSSNAGTTDSLSCISAKSLTLKFHRINPLKPSLYFQSSSIPCLLSHSFCSRRLFSVQSGETNRNQLAKNCKQKGGTTWSVSKWPPFCWVLLSSSIKWPFWKHFDSSKALLLLRPFQRLRLK